MIASHLIKLTFTNNYGSITVLINEYLVLNRSLHGVSDTTIEGRAENSGETVDHAG